MKSLILVFYVTFLFVDVYSLVDLNVDKSKVTQLTISLTRHKSQFHRLLEMGFKPHVIQELLSKRKPKPKPDVTNDTIQLFKYQDSEYYGEINLGKPGQKFTVVFDTAWADSFVPSKKCSFYNKACQAHKQYDSSRSSTAVPIGTPFSVTFPNQSMTGFLSQDLLHLGHINVTNQTFAEITSLPDIFLSNKADGIFGMAFKELSNHSMQPFFYNIMNQFKNMPKMFSFYLNKDTTTKKGGSLILGGISDKHYNPNTTQFVYLPVTKPLYWTVNMSSVYFKHPTETLCERTCDAYFDTGSGLISVPKDDFNKTVKHINAYEVPGTNRYAVNCMDVLKLPDITFAFKEGEFHLKGKEYIQEVQIGPHITCLIAFEKSNGDAWGLGGAFLYRYYSVFDYDKKAVGLAPVLQ